MLNYVGDTLHSVLTILLVHAKASSNFSHCIRLRLVLQEMQDQLLKCGAATEAQAKVLSSQLTSKDVEIAQLMDKQVQQQRLHDNEVTEMQKKQNILQSEFADMLKDTVQHLHAQRRAAYAQIARV